jgi:hypothetical protein
MKAVDDVERDGGHNGDRRRRTRHVEDIEGVRTRGGQGPHDSGRERPTSPSTDVVIVVRIGFGFVCCRHRHYSFVLISMLWNR